MFAIVTSRSCSFGGSWLCIGGSSTSNFCKRVRLPLLNTIGWIKLACGDDESSSVWFSCCAMNEIGKESALGAAENRK